MVFYFFRLDIDECALWELHSCYGTCINMPGTFHCQCPDGTYGNPFTEGGCIKIQSSSPGDNYIMDYLSFVYTKLHAFLYI